MDKDFHFGATLAAARAAGQGVLDMLEMVQIARAAQYVDEFSSSPYEAVRKTMTSRNKGLAQTVQTMSALTLHNAFNYKGVDGYTAQIWPVFHFLPTGEPQVDMDIPGAENQDLSPLVCRPYGSLANALIEEARRIWSKLAGMQPATRRQDKRRQYLMRVGITLHVLADTFAHANFIGLPCEELNEVSDVRDVSQESGAEQPVSLWPMVDYSPALLSSGYGYIGHGRIGHLPDEAWRQYTYRTKWASSPIRRNNRAIYAEAYAYMVAVLKYIFGAVDTYPRNGAEAKQLAGDIGGAQALCLAPATSVEGQARQWSALHQIDSLSMSYRPFSLADDQQLMLDFGRQAWKHRDFVLTHCEELRDILDSKRITE